MFWLELLGYVLLLVAAISSSVSMNFQKLAQYSTLYHDPRSRKKKRQTPLTSIVFCRPLFVIALFLSFAASTLDFIALTWLPPATVGLFGCIAIGVNLIVTRIILSEKPKPREWYSIGMVTIGSLMAITAKVNSESEYTPAQLLDRTSSCVYITLNWILFIIAAVALEYAKVPKWMHQFGYPFIGGALGAQNVCMGKYIAYAVSNITQYGHLTTRVDVFVATIFLCVSSVIVHIIWLNRGLEKHDAYVCVIVYQTAWFLFTTLAGIIVYDNMATLSLLSQLAFFAGCGLAAYGVWNISIVHNTPESNVKEEETGGLDPEEPEDLSTRNED